MELKCSINNDENKTRRLIIDCEKKNNFIQCQMINDRNSTLSSKLIRIKAERRRRTMEKTESNYGLIKKRLKI